MPNNLDIYGFLIAMVKPVIDYVDSKPKLKTVIIWALQGVIVGSFVLGMGYMKSINIEDKVDRNYDLMLNHLIWHANGNP